MSTMRRHKTPLTPAPVLRIAAMVRVFAGGTLAQHQQQPGGSDVVGHIDAAQLQPGRIEMGLRLAQAGSGI